MKNARLFAVFILAASILWIGGNILFKGNKSVETQMTAGMQKEKTKPLVIKKTLTAEEKSKTLRLFGQTSANKNIKLSSKINGEILELFFDGGEYVKEGQVLARISQETRPQRLRQAEANVADAKANYEAIKKLATQKFRSENQVIAAEAQLALAEANLEAVKLDIEYMEIIAPFAGIVENKQVDVGSVVNIGTPVADLMQITPLLVTVHVSENDIHQVSDDSLAVVVIGEEKIQAKVENISTRANPITRTFAVDISLDNKDRKINVGETATVLLSVSKVWAHFVSPAFIAIDERGEFGVKAVDEESKVVFYPAKMVDDSAEGIWISGLPKTFDIITLGSAYVKQGQYVEAYYSQEQAHKAASIRDVQALLDEVNPEKIKERIAQEKLEAEENLKKAEAIFNAAEQKEKQVKSALKDLKKRYEKIAENLSDIKEAKEELADAEQALRLQQKSVEDAAQLLEQAQISANKLKEQYQGEK